MSTARYGYGRWLKQREANTKLRKKLEQDRRRKMRAAEAQIDTDMQKQFDDLKVAEDRIAKELVAHNSFQEGAQFRRLNFNDGLPGVETYQVTRVVDHEYVWVRRVLSNKSLGAHSVRFCINDETRDKFVRVPEKTAALPPKPHKGRR